MTSPTARTLAHFHKKRWPADVVERILPHTYHRSDLFGFLDIVVLDLDSLRILGIQCTTADNAAARVKKITGERGTIARHWLTCGGIIEVWGWREYAKTAMGGEWRGKRWRPRIVTVGVGDLTTGQKKLKF